MFTVNPQSGTPIYRQLVEQVRQMIISGQLEPGETLPSVRALGLEHAINPMTISKAYTLLEAQGLLERNPGKPMTVAGIHGGGGIANGLQRFEGPVRALVLSARELELEKRDVVALLDKLWEQV